MDFRVPELGKEVEAIGGHYLFTDRKTLEHTRGNVVYLVGCAVTDRSCCGRAGCSFAFVLGFAAGECTGREHPVTISVDPVPENLRGEIARVVKDVEPVGQVLFLLGDRGVEVVF
ncbi:MAG TPA: hypothetical protein PLW83_09685 [Deltaproteobacteria bacterium]|nr:hypothetical protein [Deltaproteobacteria bacterium]